MIVTRKLPVLTHLVLIYALARKDISAMGKRFANGPVLKNAYTGAVPARLIINANVNWAGLVQIARKIAVAMDIRLATKESELVITVKI